MITNETLRERRRAERSLRKSTEGGDLSQWWRLAAPWLLLAAALVLAPLAWLLTWLGDVQVFTAACIAVAGAVMTAVSWSLTRGRRPIGRAHELFNAAAPAALIAYTVAYGPDKYALIGGAVAGVTSAIVWNRRHTSSAMRELERSPRVAGLGRMSEEWKAFAREYMPQLAESTLTVFADTKDVLHAGLDLGDGEVPSDFTEQLTEKFTKFAGGVRGGTVLQVGDFLDKVGITVMRTDPLKAPFPWAGVLDPGESIREPIRGLGRHRDGADLTLHLPHVPGGGLNGEDKPQAHLLMVGMSRAGKGEAGETIDVNVMTRRDSAVVLCDAVKADQQLGVIGKGAVYVLPNQNAIRAFLRRLVEQTIPARAAHLGNPRRNPLGKVCKEWQPGCGLTWLLVHVYEGAALYNNQDLTRLSERAASVGIELVLEAQKAIHDRVDTNARSNLADVIMFGVQDPDDATLALPPELIDAGASPWVWLNKRAGMCYTLLSHLPAARQAIPARFGRKAPDGSDIAAILEEYLHLAAPLDPVTAATWGEPYEKFAAARAREADRAPRQHAFTSPGPGTRVMAGAVLLDQAVPAGAAAVPPQPVALPAADEPEEAGFALDDPDDDEVPPDADDEATELAQVAETVVGDMAIAVDGDQEGGQVLDQAVDALARCGDDEEFDDAPPSDDPGRGEFELPDDPDESHFRPIVSRDEALDILLDVLARGIGEGGTFRPSDLYDELDRRARRGDSWVRKCMKILIGWGCIEESGSYGVYVVMHTRRGDLDDYPE